MTMSSIAAQWLKENDPKRALNQKAHRAVGKQKRARVKARKFVAYDKWDEAALKSLERNEARFRGLGVRVGFDSYNDCARDFIRKHDKFDAPECLLLPFFTKSCTVVMSPGLKPISPARAMLSRTVAPANDGLVCRHLCGRGHMGCINPRHLAWGTPAQNSHDTRLHHGKPQTWPDISDIVRQHILTSDMPHNVVAVETKVPAAIVELVRRNA